MKFITIVVIVIGACIFGGWKLLKAKDEMKGLGNFLPSTTDKQYESQPQFQPEQEQSVNESNGLGVEVDSSYNETYVFKYRDVPPQETLSNAASALEIIIFPDSQSRTVYVTGRIDRVRDFVSFLSNIDKMPGSCAVQTWAVFVDKTAQKGFDLTAAINSVIPSVRAASIGNGIFTLDASAENIALALTVIADGSSVEVLQRPHVRLEHGQMSRIESISEVPIPVTSNSQGVVQTSVEYRKVGLQLEVTPFFLSRDLLNIKISQTNGLIGQSVDIGENKIPIIQSQTVATTTSLTVGQTVILGGVSTQRKTVGKGLLRNVTEVSEGALYVILSTSYDVPKAVPVPERYLPSAFSGVPLSNGEDEFDGQVLPPLQAK